MRFVTLHLHVFKPSRKPEKWKSTGGETKYRVGAVLPIVSFHKCTHRHRHRHTDTHTDTHRHTQTRTHEDKHTAEVAMCLKVPDGYGAIHGAGCNELLPGVNSKQLKLCEKQ